MTIKTWPQADMPKEKLLNHGAAYLTDAELLAILINTGIQGKTALEISKTLLHEFDNLKNVFNANYTQLKAHSGIGQNKYILFQVVIELSKRYMSIPINQGCLLSSVAETKQFLIQKLCHYTDEVFAAIFLNNRHRVIRYEVLFHGTVNHATIYPREIIKKVLLYNASAIIFAHNHPSGEVKPSYFDKSITQQLKNTLNNINVSVLDHFIIGNQNAFSFKENKLL
ncbi:MAG: hypothetical protein CMF49_05330 [Legionellales bacterium]|nr:hypothetical protein [Legionellales bacterium]|tara:strand:+ start:206 stop:880 length:675 start_codon:yes stop_codon:yes gene_type:complete